MILIIGGMKKNAKKNKKTNRYIQSGSNQSVYSLVLPVQGCGTMNKEGFLSNILVFQSDPVVQVN